MTKIIKKRAKRKMMPLLSKRLSVMERKKIQKEIAMRSFRLIQSD